jgi:GDP-mannose 6-dehydrogenase
LLRGALVSNKTHVERALSLIAASGHKRVALLGLTFKSGTDDMRESPAVTLAERLLGKGYTLTVHDPELVDARIVGTNLAYVSRELPHLSRLLCATLEDAVSPADIIVLTRSGVDTRALATAVRPGQTIVDLAGTLSSPPITGVTMEGLAWPSFTS